MKANVTGLTSGKCTQFTESLTLRQCVVFQLEDVTKFVTEKFKNCSK